MTEEIINTDDYFFEITDEGRGTIDYGCVSYRTVELVRRIHKQNKQLKRLEQENKELKKDVQLFKCLNTFGESECHCACRCLGNEFCEDADKKINSYRSALEEISGLASPHCTQCSQIINIINEVLK